MKLSLCIRSKAFIMPVISMFAGPLLHPGTVQAHKKPD